LFAALVLANIRVLPHESPVYGFVWAYAVPLAIPMMLLQVDLRSLISQLGDMLLPMLTAIGATVLGTVLAANLVDIGPATAQLAGVFAATYIGGSVNFVSTTKAVGLEGDALIASAVAVDTLAGALFLAVLLCLPASAALTRWLASPRPAEDRGDRDSTARQPHTATESAIAGDVGDLPLRLSSLFAVAASICFAGRKAAEFFAVPGLDLTIVTVLTVIVGSVFQRWTSSLLISTQVGLVLFYAFFVAVAASARLAAVVEVAPRMMLFVLLVHLLCMLIAARVFRFGIERLVVASNACVLGPPAAAAVAGARGWMHLISPGVVCGILGYVVANFAGLLIFRWLS
jgi:uncharacterized membrane protein